MNTILRTKELVFENFLYYKDIAIESCKMTVITGESGCGKSTLFKLFNKTANMSSGEILYNENNIKEIDAIDLRRNILLVSQSSFIFDGDIENNFNEYYKHLDKNAPTKEMMEYYLKLCWLEKNINDDCVNFSGGEKQRLFLAIHLSLHPEVLLLDEPSSALDDKIANQVIGNIKDYCLANNITPVMITHNEKLAEQFSDEWIKM